MKDVARVPAGLSIHVLVACCLALPTFFANAGNAAPDKLTYVDLVHRLTDLEQLATLPAPGEKCSQWSSYDRASRYDEATGKYVGWDANGDGDGFIRKEGDQFVFAEMEGPGCIWRIWSAEPEQGHVRIYLDGAREPTVDLPFMGYFDGKNEPFTRSALVHTVAMGWNNYTPIPYQKSCKIVADKGWGAYYQFVYTTYPKGTQVPTFKRQLSAEENAALDEANKSPEPRAAPPRPGVRQKRQPRKATVTIEPGDRYVATLDGPQAITGFAVSGKFENREDEIQALRDIVLQITWDDEDKPAVWSPLGDFFGTAPGANLYRSFPLGMTEEGYYCNWYMPFATQATVRVHQRRDQAANTGPERRPTRLCGSPSSSSGGSTPNGIATPSCPRIRSGRRSTGRCSRPRAGAASAASCSTSGTRAAVGGARATRSSSSMARSSPPPSAPARRTTSAMPGATPRCSRTPTTTRRSAMNNRGHISRQPLAHHGQHPLPEIVRGRSRSTTPTARPTLYAATVYWYQAAGQSDPYEPVPQDQRTGYWGPIQVTKVKGAMEGEELKILAKTGGNPAPQDLSLFGDGWSSESHLWWIETPSRATRSIWPSRWRRPAPIGSRCSSPRRSITASCSFRLMARSSASPSTSITTAWSPPGSSTWARTN